MYTIEPGTPITVIGPDGIPVTDIITRKMRFKKEHVRYRPLKASRHTESFTFVWMTLTVTVAGRYVLEAAHSVTDPRSLADPGFVGPRPRRHFFQPMRTAS
jgi:hypothetical protein